MQTDVLGHPYERRTIDLGRDDEGRVVATLVRRRSPAPTGRAVLWLHGWADYFFQTHVADFFVALGYDFYALELRKCGRSWLPHQTPHFCRSLAEYLPELDRAAHIIRHEEGHDRLVVMAHSTSGLIASLWVHRRRSARLVDALILNSPFFDLNLPKLLSRPVMDAVVRLSRHQPYRVIPHPIYPVYGQSLHADLRGEWSYDLAWKPVGGYPIRLGWLSAILTAQRRLRSGLAIDVPVLVACSTRSYRGRRWHELARRADTVLDVRDMLRWAPSLGRQVTVLRVNGGLHDLTLSARPVRDAFFGDLARWLRAYADATTSDGATEEPVVPSRNRARRSAASSRPHRPGPSHDSVPPAAGMLATTPPVKRYPRRDVRP